MARAIRCSRRALLLAKAAVEPPPHDAGRRHACCRVSRMCSTRSSSAGRAHVRHARSGDVFRHDRIRLRRATHARPHEGPRFRARTGPVIRSPPRPPRGLTSVQTGGEPPPARDSIAFTLGRATPKVARDFCVARPVGVRQPQHVAVARRECGERASHVGLLLDARAASGPASSRACVLAQRDVLGGRRRYVSASRFAAIRNR